MSQDFEKYGNEWWNPEGKLISLHRINPLRFEYFSGKAGNLKGKTTLDIGCGGGLLSEKFAEKGALVTGIDLSPVAIDAAKKHSKASNLDINYLVASPFALLSQGCEPFDMVICAEVLEHVEDLEGFLRDSVELLKPGGLFFFSTINRTLRARFFAVFVAEDLLGMVPRGTHDYKRFIKPSTLFEILGKNSVDLMEIKGMTYDPLGPGFRVSDDPSVNYMGYGVKR